MCANVSFPPPKNKLAFLLCDPGWCAHKLYTERCRLTFRINGMPTHTHTHTHTHQTPGVVLACSTLKLCVVSTYTWHIAHIQKGTNGAARSAEVVDPERETRQKITGLEHENSLKPQRGTSTDRWNKAQKTQPVSTGRGEWGGENTCLPAAKRLRGKLGKS